MKIYKVQLIHVVVRIEWLKNYNPPSPQPLVVKLLLTTNNTNIFLTPQLKYKMLKSQLEFVKKSPKGRRMSL